MSLVHYESGVFYAWIDGVLTTIPIGGGGSSSGANLPYLINEDYEPFEPILFGNQIQLSKSSEISISTTGTINDLDFGNASLVRMNNASLTTINGLKAGSPGQIVTLVSIGAGNVSFAHQNAGSVAENRLINLATSAPSSLAAGFGIATYQYDLTTARWRLINHDQGAYISEPHVSGDFTGNDSMVWTVESGDLAVFKYYLKGKQLTVSFIYNFVSVSGTPSTELRTQYPGNFTVSIQTRNSVVLYNDNGGTLTHGTYLHNVGDAGITNYSIRKAGDAAWSASTNNTFLVGMFTITVD